MSGAQTGLPVDVDDLTAAWFSQVLERDVTDATVVDASSGTTGRARVALRGEPGVPATVFVKLAPFGARQRAFVERTGMGVAEARFYRDVAGEVPVRVPGVWYAETDGRDYVMVLEDLVAAGCAFPSPDDRDIAARARDIVEQLAALHTRYWESARFDEGGDLEWLAGRAMRGGEGGGRFIERAVDVLGDRIDESFHRIARIYVARTADIVQLWREGPGTLVHGDSHLGNLFVDGSRTGFLDWAVVCRAPGVRDVAYVLCNSIPADVREVIERELVDRYCELLARGGVALDPAVAWDQYRLHAVYSWVAATSTAGMGSRWQPISVGLGGTVRATAACAHLDSAGLLESLLG
ncbi:MAG TPA: phosphotransferase [Acidimicrobiia bacterium]|nr:phosphotransferase [Acidimicrobiia bacterium]